MKKFILFFSILTLTAFTTHRFQPLNPIEQIIPLPIEIPTTTFDTVDINFKGHSDFLSAMGHQESRNRYHIVNRYGYMGKYQFGKSTLKTLRIKVSRKEFLKDTLLQEEAMLKLLLHNKKRLQKYINKYETIWRLHSKFVI